jgi:hypothetical protein
MILRFLLVCVFVISTATVAAADTVDIGFSDESFQFVYEKGLAQDEYGTALFNGRFLYNDDKDTRLGSLGLDFVGRPGNIAGLGLGAGAKIYVGKADPDIDFMNLGIGLLGDYVFPQLQGLGISARLNYAPKVFSFRDSERLLESEVRLTYAVLPKVRLYLGYQHIRLDVEDRSGHSTIDDSFRIGFVGAF